MHDAAFYGMLKSPASLGEKIAQEGRLYETTLASAMDSTEKRLFTLSQTMGSSQQSVFGSVLHIFSKALGNVGENCARLSARCYTP